MPIAYGQRQTCASATAENTAMTPAIVQWQIPHRQRFHKDNSSKNDKNDRDDGKGKDNSSKPTTKTTQRCKTAPLADLLVVVVVKPTFPVTMISQDTKGKVYVIP